MIRIFKQFLTPVIFCALALGSPSIALGAEERDLSRCLLQRDQSDAPLPVSQIIPYQIEDSALLLRPPVTRQGFSNVMFDERARTRLAQHRLLLVLSWTHGPGDALTTHQTATHLEQLAAEYERSIWFMGLHGEEILQDGQYRARLKTFIETHREQANALDVSFYEGLCQALPPDHVLLAEPKRGLQSAHGVLSWTIHIARPTRGGEVGSWKEQGLIAMTLLPAHRLAHHRAQEARKTFLLVLAIVAAILLVGALLWYRRRHNPEALWRLDPSEDEEERGREERDLVQLFEHMEQNPTSQWFEQARALWPRASPTDEAFIECVHARQRLYHMLEAQHRLQRRARRLSYRLLRGHELLQAQSELYREQVARFDELMARPFFNAQSSLWQALGYEQESREKSGVFAELERLRALPVPDFDRRRAPEPWMAHLVAWYVWCDLVCVELSLRMSHPA